jgi:NarL family two-component system sensor histidine kinase LiaS
MTQFDPGQMADRARLARELHDGIAQDLVGVGYGLDILLANPETTLDARTQLRTLRFAVTDLIDKVRKEIFLLTQPSSLALSEEIRNTATSLCGELELELHLDEMTTVLNSELSHEILKIAKEVLRNIAVHAKATTVTISLELENNELTLFISDDGIGGAAISDTRYGIQGIRDRALNINASIEIHSDSEGTRILLRVPVEEHASL